jgi:hypothetical protein
VSRSSVFLVRPDSQTEVTGKPKGTRRRLARARDRASRLRPLSTDERDSLHRISNEPSVRLYLWEGEAISETTITDLIARSDRRFSAEKIGVFGVRMRGRGEIVSRAVKHSICRYFVHCAGGGTRTHTTLRPPDFESGQISPASPRVSGDSAYLCGFWTSPGIVRSTAY